MSALISLNLNAYNRFELQMIVEILWFYTSAR